MSSGIGCADAAGDIVDVMATLEPALASPTTSVSSTTTSNVEVDGNNDVVVLVVVVAIVVVVVVVVVVLLISRAVVVVVVDVVDVVVRSGVVVFVGHLIKSYESSIVVEGSNRFLHGHSGCVRHGSSILLRSQQATLLLPVLVIIRCHGV